MHRSKINSYGQGKALNVMCLLLAAAMIIVFAASGEALAKKGPDHSYYGYSGPAMAPQGGYTGPGPELTSVTQTLSLGDDSRVALKGKITRSLGGKAYMFSDASGSVQLKIDPEVWMGQQVGADDTVEIHGKLKKDWTRTRIDVKRLIKQ